MDIASREPILAELRKSPVVAVTFGGMQHGVGAPLFEFFRTLQSIDVASVFVRDYAQCWYHAGVAGHESIDALAGRLRELTGGYRRVVCIGNSMGGYAALLFGWLLGADQVIAFTPQTCLDDDFRSRFGDTRWERQIESLRLLRQRREDLYDLSKLPRQGSGFKRAQVIYPENVEIDALHARQVEALRGVEMTARRSTYGHKLAEQMRDSGELLALLREALER